MTSPPDTIPIPQSFRSEHVNHSELAESLGMTGSEVIAAMTAGEIPAGVPLLTVTGHSMLVWPTADIVDWMQAGRPVNAELHDRTRRVLTALRDSIEVEYGADLETLAETINSRN